MSTRVPEDGDGDGDAPPRGWPIVRYVAGLAVGVVVLVVLYSQRGDLRAVAREFSRVKWAWLVAAVLAEASSILAFAGLQRVTLRLGGARINMARLFVVSLANDAIANTVPGEPAVSSAYRFGQYRRRGASAAGAAWVIMTIMITQAIALSILLLIGVVVALMSGSPGDLTGATIGGLVVVLAAGALLVRRDALLSVVA